MGECFLGLFTENLRYWKPTAESIKIYDAYFMDINLETSGIGGAIGIIKNNLTINFDKIKFYNCQTHGYGGCIGIKSEIGTIATMNNIIYNTNYAKWGMATYTECEYSFINNTLIVGDFIKNDSRYTIYDISKLSINSINTTRLCSASAGFHLSTNYNGMIKYASFSYLENKDNDFFSVTLSKDNTTAITFDNIMVVSVSGNSFISAYKVFTTKFVKSSFINASFESMTTGKDTKVSFISCCFDNFNASYEEDPSIVEVTNLKTGNCDVYNVNPPEIPQNNQTSKYEKKKKALTLSSTAFEIAVQHSIFDGIKSSVSGAAIHGKLYEANVQIREVIFSKCEAFGRSAPLHGGAVSLWQSFGSVSISKCCADNCLSNSAHFISVISSGFTTTQFNVTFVTNCSNSENAGAASISMQGTYLSTTMDSSNISNCRADRLAVGTFSSLVLGQCVISDCLCKDSTQYGDSILRASTISSSDSIFFNNKMIDGSIVSSIESADFLKCTFFGNIVKYTCDIQNSDKLILKNCVFDSMDFRDPAKTEGCIKTDSFKLNITDGFGLCSQHFGDDSDEGKQPEWVETVAWGAAGVVAFGLIVMVIVIVVKKQRKADQTLTVSGYGAPIDLSLT